MMTEGEVSRLRAIASDSKLTVDEIDGWLARIDAERAELLDVQVEIAASAPAGDFLNQREQSIAAAVRDDLLMVAHGVPFSAGVTNRRLEKRRGQPGLVELDDVEMRLRVVRERVVSHDAIWGNVKMLPHRYTGAKHKTLWDGQRYLEPGDVVDLTEQQAIAFRDRFELVSADAAVTRG